MQLNVNYIAPRITILGTVQRRGATDIAFDKRLGDHWTLGCKVTDVFNRQGFYGYLRQPTITQDIEFKWLTRRFYLNVSYKFGKLEYRSLHFENEVLSVSDFQGIAGMNYGDVDVPYTRIIEHKHFEKSESPISWITYETPVEYRANETEPYYPVNDSENNLKYSKYKELGDSQSKYIFGGRLAEYKYYDMHQVIKSALDTVKTLIKK